MGSRLPMRASDSRGDPSHQPPGHGSALLTPFRRPQALGRILVSGPASRSPVAPDPSGHTLLPPCTRGSSRFPGETRSPQGAGRRKEGGAGVLLARTGGHAGVCWSVRPAGPRVASRGCHSPSARTWRLYNHRNVSSCGSGAGSPKSRGRRGVPRSRGSRGEPSSPLPAPGRCPCSVAVATSLPSLPLWSRCLLLLPNVPL